MKILHSIQTTKSGDQHWIMAETNGKKPDMPKLSSLILANKNIFSNLTFKWVFNSVYFVLGKTGIKNFGKQNLQILNECKRGVIQI